MLQGDAALEKRAALRRVLQDSELARRLEERALQLGKPLAELVVLVKPTFMLACTRADGAIVTDPELVDELARWLVERGVAEVVVAEGRTLYDRFHANRGVREVARYLGYSSNYYRVADLHEDQVPHEYPRGMAQASLARAWRDADFRISFAKMRSHPVDFTHLVIAGLQGVGGRFEDFLFAERQAQRSTALLMPLTEFPPHFALIDAYESAGDGLVGILRCPDPPRPRRLYAGEDALAVDVLATRHMGMADPRDSAVLGAACHWFGDPADATEVVGTDAPVPGWRHPYSNGWWRLLSLMAYPVYEFASGRGEAFLPPMDEEAFPPLERPRGFRRVRRALFRALLGVGAPA